MHIEEIFRTEHGRILATLIRVLGDFDVAEEALQEAFEVALEQWPAAGLPDNPVAWLIGTARHKAIDRIRRRALLAQKQDEIARHLELLAEEEEAPVPEDRLRLIFTCCHPALATEAQVALTLRTLGRMLVELLPARAEPMGLLALMLLHDARRETRLDGAGDIVLLQDQDRTRWDHAQIDEGAELVETALRESGRPPGPYALQAAIAAVHAQ